MARSRKTQPRLWETTFLVNRAIIRTLRAIVPQYFPPSSTARILDVGCGNMPYRGLFDGRCAEYKGCDLFPLDPAVVQCPSDKLCFSDHEFDAVVSFQVLEHVPRPWQTIAECARVLKPGGVLLVTTPFIFPQHASPYDFFRYTHDGLKSLAQAAGLAPDLVVGQCGSLATLALLASWYATAPLVALRRRRLGWLAALGTLGVIVPLNLLGMLLDSGRLRRPYEKGSQGYSNYLIVCRKP